VTATLAPYRRAAHAMGTVVSVHVYDAPGDGATTTVADAVDGVFVEIERLESMFSTFRADSAISRINRGELTPADADPEVCDVLDACSWLDHASGGAFRAFRPDNPARLDPSGFVKGWATERAAQRLTDAGYSDWCVNAGGDIVASGTPPDGKRWRVGIADPLRPGSVRATVEIAGGAVATSGTAERGTHLWDGRTGSRVAPFASLTVIGPTLTWADAFATAAFALGDDGLDWVARFDGYEAMAIRTDATIATSNVRRAS
jgi:thiamine biosynthesis lipoprotein